MLDTWNFFGRYKSVHRFISSIRTFRKSLSIKMSSGTTYCVLWYSSLPLSLLKSNSSFQSRFRLNSKDFRLLYEYYNEDCCSTHLGCNIRVVKNVQTTAEAFIENYFIKVRTPWWICSFWDKYVACHSKYTTTVIVVLSSTVYGTRHIKSRFFFPRDITVKSNI